MENEKGRWDEVECVWQQVPQEDMRSKVASVAYSQGWWTEGGGASRAKGFESGVQAYTRDPKGWRHISRESEGRLRPLEADTFYMALGGFLVLHVNKC